VYFFTLIADRDNNKRSAAFHWSMSGKGKRGREAEADRERKRQATAQEDVRDEVVTYPPGVVLIARRNKSNHFFLPTQDTTFCGIVCRNVMIDNGCNTCILPFPKDNRNSILAPFQKAAYTWEVAWSGGTGAIHCPVLKILPSVGDSVGDMQFGITGYKKSMPFLRFHLGREEAEFLISLKTKMLVKADKDVLRRFLVDIGTRNVLGRTTAMLGQTLLRDLIVVQAGKVMFLLRPEDVDINPLRLGNECVQATKALVKAFDGFNDLYEADNDYFDEDGVVPEDED